MEKGYIHFLILLLVVILVIPEGVLGWNDDITHRSLSGGAVLCSQLSPEKENLLAEIGIELGIRESLEWPGHVCDDDNRKSHCSVDDWIRYGAEKEDQATFIPAIGRFGNHFHNPLDGQGLSGPFGGESTLVWAQDNTSQSEWDNPEGDQSWSTLRTHYYNALTVSDLASDDAITERNIYFAQLFKGLGHQMHLVQDMAVPYHVRNDAHPSDSLQGDDNWIKRKIVRKNPLYFENWVKQNDPDLKEIAQTKALFPDLLFDESYPDDDRSDVPISQLWDINSYDGTNPSDSLSQGLAEYTNANFFSEHTVFAAEKYANDPDHEKYFPYPNQATTTLLYFADILPETFISKDGKLDFRLYLKKVDHGETEELDHFVRVGYFANRLIQGPDLYLYTLSFYLDEECHRDYAQKLVGRASGYSATLLDYFFRGKMAIQNPVFTHTDDFTTLSGISFNVKNVSTLPNSEQTSEAFESGHLHLAYQYTPPGQSHRVYGLTEEFYTITDADDPINSEPVDQFVWFTEPIPKGSTDIACQVVFRGKLGLEENAVAATKIDFLKSRIAYCHQPGGRPNSSDIKAVFPDGTETVSISGYSDFNQWYYGPSWSPNGSVMALEKESCEDGSADGVCTDYPDNQNYFRDIVLVDLKSESSYPDSIIQDFRLYDPENFGVNPYIPVGSPSFSPDGSQFVAKIDDLGHQYWGLIIVDSDSGNWRYINNWEFWRDKRLIGSGPDWNPADDTIVYYVHQEPDPVSNHMVDARDIYVIDKTGRVNARLTHDDYFNTHPSWSPDGEWIVFVTDRDGGGYMDVWVMDRDGGNMQKVFDCESSCWSPSFSPDGLSLTFQSNGNLFTIDTNGGNLEQLTDMGNSGSPEWSPYLDPPEVDITANPPQTEPGETSMLTWSSADAYAVEINEGIGSVELNGSIDVLPDTDTTYTVTANGFGGQAADSVTVGIKHQ